MAQNPTYDVTSPSQTPRRIGRTSSTSATGETFTTIAAVLPETPIYRFQNQGTDETRVLGDGRIWQAPLSADPSVLTVGDLWLQTTAGTTSPRYRGAQGTETVATQSWVALLTNGLNNKQYVRACATSNITLSGTQTVDGVALIAGDPCLVTGQSTPANNGIYLVAAGAWTRRADADTWAELISASCTVSEGTVNADTWWVCRADAGGTLGVTALTWVQFAQPGVIVGANLGSGAQLYASKVGTTLNFRSVLGTTNQLTVTQNTNDVTLSLPNTLIAPGTFQAGANSLISGAFTASTDASPNFGVAGFAVQNTTTLGSTAGNRTNLLNITSPSANTDYLQVLHRRVSAGSDWQTAEIRIQKVVDASPMEFIAFRGATFFGGPTGIVFGNGLTDRMYVDSSGGVCIGASYTAAGAGNLLVSGTGSFNGGFAYVAGTTGAPSVAVNAQYMLADGWRIIRSTPASASRAWDLTVSDTVAQYRVVDGAYTGAFTYMTVSRTGNTDASVRFDTATGISIGMAAAGAGAPNSLSVAGNIGAGIGASTTAGEKIRWSDGTRTVSAGCDANQPWFGTTTANDMRFISNNVERFRLFSSGGLYVGSTAVDPGINCLTVQATTTTGTARTGKLQVAVVSGVTNPAISCWVDTTIAGEYHLVNGWANSSNPGILVGTSRTDGLAFQVANGLTRDGVTYLPNNVGTPQFTVYGSGGVWVGSTRSDPGANNLTVQGVCKVNSTTATTSPTTGALIVAGGVGATGGVFGTAANYTIIGGTYLEIGAGNTDNTTYIDFHSAEASVPGQDYSGRILRVTGTNGAFGFEQTGTGGYYWNNAGATRAMSIYSSGGLYVGASPADPGANNLTVQGVSTLGANSASYTGNVLYGVQNATAAVAYQVGQIVESKISTATNAAATGTFLALTSITLTPGDWVISATANEEPGTGASTTSGGALEALIGTTTASNAGATRGYDWIKCSHTLATSDSNALTIPAKRVNISSSTTYYLNVLQTFTAGTPQWRGSLTATRIR